MKFSGEQKGWSQNRWSKGDAESYNKKLIDDTKRYELKTDTAYSGRRKEKRLQNMINNSIYLHGSQITKPIINITIYKLF